MQLRCTLWILHIGTGCFLTSSWCNWKWTVKVKRKSVMEEMQQKRVQVQFGLLTKEGGITSSGSCVTHSGWKKDFRKDNIRQTLWDKQCTISLLLFLFITCNRYEANTSDDFVASRIVLRWVQVPENNPGSNIKWLICKTSFWRDKTWWLSADSALGSIQFDLFSGLNRDIVTQTSLY